MTLESDQATRREQADSTLGARPVWACEGMTWDDGAQNVMGWVWVQTGLGRSRLELSKGAIQRAGARYRQLRQPDVVMVGAGMGTLLGKVTRLEVDRGVLG